MNRHAARVLAAVAALGLIAAACGGDDPTASTTVTMSVRTANDTAMDQSMPAMDDMGTGHSHEMIDWPTDLDVPQLNLTASPHQDGSVDLVVDIRGFKLQSGDGVDGPAGSGHLHVLVDGRDSGMWFTPTIRLQGIDPGTHGLEIRLSAPDHGMYSIDGDPLSYTAEFVIPGVVPVTDAVISISVDDSGVVGGIVDASVHIGDLVELRIDSAVAETIHLHVYDIEADLVPGKTTTLTFTADIPGVFEAELEGPGLQILNLEVK